MKLYLYALACIILCHSQIMFGAANTPEVTQKFKALDRLIDDSNALIRLTEETDLVATRTLEKIEKASTEEERTKLTNFMNLQITKLKILNDELAHKRNQITTIQNGLKSIASSIRKRSTPEE